ncbi:MAG TPA: L,D-transpeptidase [Solirubrobacteraceae bacterium]|nr:L,D-transpeptidase [Solirubrobacteraceae bacterium]
MLGQRQNLRTLLIVLICAIPLVPIAIGLSLGNGTPPVATHAAAPPVAFTPVDVRPAPATSTLVPPGPGSVVAQLRRPVSLRTTPGGRRSYGRLTTVTPFGSPQTLLVVRFAGPWLGVLSPVAGNGRVGWIPAVATALTRERWHLSVSLSARRLTVADGRRTVARWRIAVGAPASPTPTGTFQVTDRLRTGNPSGPYGCCVLALSAVAPHAIQGWTGGNRVAIHSTPETSSIGLPVSHGCMRLTLAQGAWLLRHIPLGTPTVIRT